MLLLKFKYEKCEITILYILYPVVYCQKWRWIYAKGRGEGPEGTLLIYDH